ncbi:hypothetical protein BKA61DRAFT_89607 [Leptodontidium sp. MPI-SDFR-AT-0119]|nr:hypothetical protein BKA61DRAFT_89607 [Leptodontidium sp. MPI-SDFR-AT-0119]
MISSQTYNYWLTITCYPCLTVHQASLAPLHTSPKVDSKHCIFLITLLTGLLVPFACRSQDLQLLFYCRLDLLDAHLASPAFFPFSLSSLSTGRK